MDAVNLQKAYSSLNEHLAKQFDAAGVKRSLTVPYIDGQSTADHMNAVGQAASTAGGLGKNLVTTFHHSGGKGWGHGDGQTVGHPSDTLRTTIIPKNDEAAKSTITAAQKYLSDIGSLLGKDEPSVKTAQGQLDLVKKTDGAGMHLQDFGVMMIQLMHSPTQAVARAHQGTKPGGHSPKLSPPGPGAAPEAQTDQSGASGSPAPPEAAEASPAPSATPAAPAPAEAPAQGQ